MALGDDYITLSELSTWMGLTTADGFDDLMSDSIESSTQEITRFCHRDFNDSGSVSARTYFPYRHPDFGPVIQTDDFNTDTGLIVACDGTTFDDDSLILKPLNGLMQGLPWPYTSIAGAFTIGKKVSVTAQWGWSAVPKPVSQAARMLAQDTFQMKDVRFSNAGSDAFGQVMTVKDNRFAKAKLQAFVRDAVLMDS